MVVLINSCHSLMGFIFLAQLRMLSGCGEHARPYLGKRGEMQPGLGQKL